MASRTTTYTPPRTNMPLDSCRPAHGEAEQHHAEDEPRSALARWHVRRCRPRKMRTKPDRSKQWPPARQNEINERATVVATTTFAVRIRSVSEAILRVPSHVCRQPVFYNEPRGVGQALPPANLTGSAKRQRAHQVVADVRDNVRVRKPGRGAQPLPLRVRPNAFHTLSRPARSSYDSM